MKARPRTRKQLDAGACAGVAGQRFSGGSGGLALTEAAEAGGQRHADAGADGDEVDGGRAAIREGRNGKAKHRQGHEHELKFTHISPASLELAASGWLRLTVLAPSRLRPTVGPEWKRSPAESCKGCQVSGQLSVSSRQLSVLFPISRADRCRLVSWATAWER